MNYDNYDFDHEDRISYPELDGSSLENFDRWLDQLRANAEADADRIEALGYGYWGDDEAECGHDEYDGACSAETCGRAMTESAFRARLAEIVDAHDPANRNMELWHESVEENRILTIDEYDAMPRHIADIFVSQWISKQADKETANHMASILRDNEKRIKKTD